MMPRARSSLVVLAAAALFGTVALASAVDMTLTDVGIHLDQHWSCMLRDSSTDTLAEWCNHRTALKLSLSDLKRKICIRYVRCEALASFGAEVHPTSGVPVVPPEFALPLNSSEADEQAYAARHYADGSTYVGAAYALCMKSTNDACAAINMTSIYRVMLDNGLTMRTILGMVTNHTRDLSALAVGQLGLRSDMNKVLAKQDLMMITVGVISDRSAAVESDFEAYKNASVSNMTAVHAELAKLRAAQQWTWRSEIASGATNAWVLVVDATSFVWSWTFSPCVAGMLYAGSWLADLPSRLAIGVCKVVCSVCGIVAVFYIAKRLVWALAVRLARCCSCCRRRAGTASAVPTNVNSPSLRALLNPCAPNYNEKVAREVAQLLFSAQAAAKAAAHAPASKKPAAQEPRYALRRRDG